jgi:threonine dehydratase
VFAATTANPAKVETLRRMGAEVHLAGDDFDAAKDDAKPMTPAPTIAISAEARSGGDEGPRRIVLQRPVDIVLDDQHVMLAGQ